MKVGILLGEIPPPVFIEQLIKQLVLKECKIILYGKINKKKADFYLRGVKVRKTPQNKLFSITLFIYLLIRGVLKYKIQFISILYKIRHRESNIKNSIIRFNKIVRPLMDNLDIFHIQWAKSIAHYPDFLNYINCPLVLSLRGTHINVSPIADEKIAEKYKHYFPKIDGFHAVSNAIAQEAVKYGADTKKIHIIYPAVDENILTIENNANYKSTDTLEIISIGRCHWIKGYTTALDAMHILNKEGVNFHYTIIASGEDEENLLFQISDLNLKEKVTFINGAEHRQVLKKLLDSHLFLLPSFEEGISNSLLEAMALGIPSISTECGGIPEVINHGEDGYIIPVGCSVSIVKAVKEFMNTDNKKHLEMISKAKKKIKISHLLSQQTDEILELYNSLIK